MAPRVVDGRPRKRHYFHQLGRSRRAYGSNPPGPMPWVPGPPSSPAWLCERSGVPQGRKNPLAIETRGGRSPLLGVHPSPDLGSCPPGLTAAPRPPRRAPLIARDAVTAGSAGRRRSRFYPAPWAGTTPGGPRARRARWWSQWAHRGVTDTSGVTDISLTRSGRSS